jgi:hypothetical protein
VIERNKLDTQPEQEHALNRMANAVGSVALLWGGVLTAAHYARAENFSGAEGPIGMTVIGGATLAANYFGNKLPDDPDAAKLAEQIKKNHKNGAYF